MSYWHSPKKEDLDFSADKTELHVYLESDDSGAVYASIKVEDLREKLKELD